MAAAALSFACVTLLFATTSAYAFTSESWAPRGGWVWYNASDSNPSKGLNSFTVLDWVCGDGWHTFVYYEIYETQTAALVKSGEVVAPYCGEVSMSIYGPTTNKYIKWVAASAGSGDDREYGYWHYDSVGGGGWPG
jgi:hypothetical protein